MYDLPLVLNIRLSLDLADHYVLPQFALSGLISPSRVSVQSRVQGVALAKAALGKTAIGLAAVGHCTLAIITEKLDLGLHHRQRVQVVLSLAVFEKVSDGQATDKALRPLRTVLLRFL